jgi:hypothetical protein
MFSEFPVAADAAAWVTARFPRLSVVLVVAGVDSLDAMQLRRTALLR